MTGQVHDTTRLIFSAYKVVPSTLLHHLPHTTTTTSRFCSNYPTITTTSLSESPTPLHIHYTLNSRPQNKQSRHQYVFSTTQRCWSQAAKHKAWWRSYGRKLVCQHSLILYYKTKVFFSENPPTQDPVHIALTWQPALPKTWTPSQQPSKRNGKRSPRKKCWRISNVQNAASHQRARNTTLWLGPPKRLGFASST